MATELFSNNAISTLGSAVGLTDTTITLATGTGTLFPVITTGQFFSVTLFAAGSTTESPNEIVYCTARTGDTLTVVRAQENTAAHAWNVGDTVGNFPTAAFFNGVANSGALQLQAGNYAADTGTANSGIISLTPVPASLASIVGMPIRVKKTTSSNTGGYTLNVNGLGAQPVTIGGLNLAANQLPANRLFEVAWNGSAFDLLSMTSAIPNTGLATMATATVKGNVSGSTAQPSDVTMSQLATALNMPPMPLAASGVLGSWQSLDTNLVSGTVSTPPSGTWAWFFINNGTSQNGVTAGGTLIFSGFLNNYGSFCWRIA